MCVCVCEREREREREVVQAYGHYPLPYCNIHHVVIYSIKTYRFVDGPADVEIPIIAEHRREGEVQETLLKSAKSGLMSKFECWHAWDTNSTVTEIHIDLAVRKRRIKTGATTTDPE